MERFYDKGTDKTSEVTRGKDEWKSMHSSRQLWDKTEEVRVYVYQIGTNDQQDLFNCTTNCVGAVYGWDLRILVKHRIEAVFTKPTVPTTRQPADIATKAAAVRKSIDSIDNAKLGIYHEKLDKCDEHKVFVIMLGRCSVGVQGWLEQGRRLDELEINRGVVGLLKLLAEKAFSSGGDQDLNLILVNCMRRLKMIQQGSKELAKYYKGVRETEVTKEAAQARLLARILLVGADKARFGSLQEDLNTKYIGRTNRNQKALEETHRLLSTVSNRVQGHPHKQDDNEARLGRSHAQKGKPSSPPAGSPSRTASPESATGESLFVKKTDNPAGENQNVVPAHHPMAGPTDNQMRYLYSWCSSPPRRRMFPQRIYVQLSKKCVGRSGPQWDWWLLDTSSRYPVATYRDYKSHSLV